MYFCKRGCVIIKFVSKEYFPLDIISGVVTIVTCIIPADKILLEYKLAAIAVIVIINLVFRLYNAKNKLNLSEKNNTELQSKLDNLSKANKNLKEKHTALASQFDKKNIDIDDLESKYESSLYLIHNINSMLHYFLAHPTKYEKDCIHEIIKYLNNNHIKE
ncbi:hypothetical protein [Clostridium beijerinckii]|uniref:hypothetical protein n=1 Tax=Clostridium beijerinckii TaxID=1520 RepID=UPI001F1FB83D|nr:hypothetical protein [Clostridium beijerinckii]